MTSRVTAAGARVKHSSLVGSSSEGLKQGPNTSSLGYAREVNMATLGTLSHLSGKTWNVYRCSPLHGFDSENGYVQCEQLARQLRTFLHGEYAAMTQQSTLEDLGSADGSNNNASLANQPGNVGIGIMEGLSITTRRGDEEGNIENKEDPPAMSIVVHSKAATRLTPLASAVLISCGSITAKDDFERETTHFPLMLLKGSPRMGQLVVQWLERTFDCLVSRMGIPPIELALMVCTWASRPEIWADGAPIEMSNEESGEEEDNNPSNEGGDKENTSAGDAYEKRGKVSAPSRKRKPTAKKTASSGMSLHFSVPYLAEKELNSIKYTIDQASMRRLYNAVMKAKGWKSQADISSTELMEVLEDHFEKLFQIKLSALPLICIGTPFCFLSADSKLKFTSARPREVLAVLNRLTNLAASNIQI
eukprot:Nk52_evm3s106 gene=Nk52_evmTU3s106